MPNGDLFGDDSYGRTKEETVSYSDVLIAARKSLELIKSLTEENTSLRSKIRELEQDNEFLKGTILAFKRGGQR